MQSILVVAALVVASLTTAAVGPVFIGYTVYIVVGESMEPAIPLGSALVIERADTSSIQRGDVITFLDRRSQIVSHRVVERVDDQLGPGFRTKGDANHGPDPEVVRPASVLGRASYHVPLAGYIIHAGYQPLARLGVVALALLVAYSQLRRHARFPRALRDVPVHQRS